MRRKYGIGISVKTVKGSQHSRSPVNMGDLRRVSHEFNTTNSFTLIVGVWNYLMDTTDKHSSSMRCRKIQNVYCSKPLNGNYRRLFFGNKTHGDIEVC